MDLTSCLFQWLKTFDLKGKCEKPQDLCDGVAITHALVQIAPEYFSTEILSKIEKECGNNWFLRVSNLRRIYLRIVDYYGEILDRTMPDKLQPDLESIARDYNLISLGKLLQLILGCAINCVNKEKHIEIMTTLSLQVKQALKIAIDELENFDENNTATASTVSNINEPTNQSFSSNINFPIDRQHTIEEFNRLQEELSMINVLKENALQRCSDLESTITKLEEEKRNLKQENEKLSKNNWSSSSSRNNQRPFDSIENENLFQRLNGQLNVAQLELSRMEEQKEDYKIQLEIKEKEYQKLLLQIDQLQTKLNEFKHDRDELDRLKYLNEEIIKYKNINDVQKKKLEEFQEHKKQMKIIEDRNASLIKQICELEEDKKSITVYKNQLDLIRKQRDELRSKMNEETFRADKMADELKRVYKKYNDIGEEKEKMQLELQKIRMELSQLRNNDSGLINVPSIDMDLSASSSSATTATTTNLIRNNNNNNNAALLLNETTTNVVNENEKLIRLEYENEKLKKQLQNSNDERIRLLESQLDDEKNRVIKLESMNRTNSQKIIELEGRLKDLPDTNVDMDGGGGAAAAGGVQFKSKLKELQIENNNLKTMLEKKNEELAEREERFKKHLNKAKETYGILETHMNNAKISSTSLPLDGGSTKTINSSDDSEYLRHLCREKDNEMEKLRQEFQRTNAIRDIEEHLMSVSFHKMTFNMQRKAAEDRVYSNNFPANSTTFLSRQRQASSRKFIIPSSDLVE